MSSSLSSQDKETASRLLGEKVLGGSSQKKGKRGRTSSAKSSSGHMNDNDADIDVLADLMNKKTTNINARVPTALLVQPREPSKRHRKATDRFTFAKEEEREKKLKAEKKKKDHETKASNKRFRNVDDMKAALNDIFPTSPKSSPPKASKKQRKVSPKKSSHSNFNLNAMINALPQSPVQRHSPPAARGPVPNPYIRPISPPPTRVPIVLNPLVQRSMSPPPSKNTFDLLAMRKALLQPVQNVKPAVIKLLKPVKEENPFRYTSSSSLEIDNELNKILKRTELEKYRKELRNRRKNRYAKMIKKQKQPSPPKKSSSKKASSKKSSPKKASSKKSSHKKHNSSHGSLIEGIKNIRLSSSPRIPLNRLNINRPATH
jgi:hypothetical protein